MSFGWFVSILVACFTMMKDHWTCFDPTFYFSDSHRMMTLIHGLCFFEMNSSGRPRYPQDPGSWKRYSPFHKADPLGHQTLEQVNHWFHQFWSWKIFNEHHFSGLVATIPRGLWLFPKPSPVLAVAEHVSKRLLGGERWLGDNTLR